MNPEPVIATGKYTRRYVDKHGDVVEKTYTRKYKVKTDKKLKEAKNEILTEAGKLVGDANTIEECQKIREYLEKYQK